MGDRRLNGVEAAVKLLKALITSGGQATNANLMERSGLSRSSWHRITRILAERGVLELDRGRVRVGPIAQALFAADSMRVQREQLQRAPHARSTGICAMGPTLSSQEVIPLSTPLQMRRTLRPMRIGFSNASLDNPWRVALVHSLEHAASNLSEGIACLTVRHAADNPDRQASDIDALVTAGSEGLVVSAISSRVVKEAVTWAMTKGVEVVMVDRRLPGTRATSFVSTSDETIGHKTALWLAKTLGGEGGVVLLPGMERAEPAQIRYLAARQVLEKYPGIRVLEVNWTGWHRGAGYAAILEAIARHSGEIAGVWCDSGLQGVGSMEAFLAAGWSTGKIPPHTGGDLNLAYKLALKHEVKLAAMDYPPAMGFRAVEVLFAALRGRCVPSRIDVATDLVLTRNAALPGMQPHVWADEHVRWDLPDDLVLASGLGHAYNPRAFRIHYPGNSYNRSAAALESRRRN